VHTGSLLQALSQAGHEVSAGCELQGDAPVGLLEQKQPGSKVGANAVFGALLGSRLVGVEVLGADGA